MSRKDINCKNRYKDNQKKIPVNNSQYVTLAYAFRMGKKLFNRKWVSLVGSKD